MRAVGAGEAAALERKLASKEVRKDVVVRARALVWCVAQGRACEGRFGRRDRDQAVTRDSRPVP